MKINKIRAAVTGGIAVTTVLLLTTNHNPTTNKDLEERASSAITFVDGNSVIHMTMSEFEKINLPLNDIDPNLLQAYRTSYDAPLLTGSIGEIIGAKLGYFKDEGFAVPTEDGGRYWARHIQKPEDIFDSGHPGMPNYYWELTIEKPKNMRGVNYVEEYPEGLKLKNGILIFPELDLESFCYFISAYQIPAWNKDIKGTYKELGTDLDVLNNQLPYYLYQIVPPIKSLKDLKLTGSKYDSK